MMKMVPGLVNSQLEKVCILDHNAQHMKHIDEDSMFLTRLSQVTFKACKLFKFNEVKNWKPQKRFQVFFEHFRSLTKANVSDYELNRIWELYHDMNRDESRYQLRIKRVYKGQDEYLNYDEL